ncbi:STX12 [Lepeophtheirus salmonis]|uniref:STX12 n=1 Tax=Lepeophtheirus salmonis TaxID=72036 RepID=A0A7R8CPM8_LEPSM|nr:STX12 [Lepeophtheirus salmonis]CAF2884685.1 STX12 [Lepeophtheirus salmonis]
MRQLESDIVDVNTIFKDLATMVHDQGEFVDSIEANVESTQVRVSEGTEQLRQAEQYKMKARKKKFMMMCIGADISVSFHHWKKDSLLHISLFVFLISSRRSMK